MKAINVLSVALVVGTSVLVINKKNKIVDASPTYINSITLSGRLNNGKYFEELGFKTELAQQASNLAVVNNKYSASTTQASVYGYLDFKYNFSASSSTKINSYLYAPFIISNNPLNAINFNLENGFSFGYNNFQRYSYTQEKLYNFGNTYYLYALTIKSDNTSVLQAPFINNNLNYRANFNLDLRINKPDSWLAFGVASFVASNYGEIYYYNGYSFISANEGSILYESLNSSYYSILGNVVNAYGAYLDAYMLYLGNYLTNININTDSYNKGFDSGYTSGYADGKASAQQEIQQDSFNTSWLTSLFNSISNILSIEIFNGFKIWYALGIPLFLSFIFIILKFFR